MAFINHMNAKISLPNLKSGFHQPDESQNRVAIPQKWHSAKTYDCQSRVAISLNWSSAHD